MYREDHDWQLNFKRAAWYEILVMSWASKMVAYVLKNHLADPEESIYIPASMHSKNLVNQFEQEWKVKLANCQTDEDKARLSVFRTMVPLFSRGIFFTTVASISYIAAVFTVATLVLPLLLGLLEEFSEEESLVKTSNLGGLTIPYEGLFYSIALGMLELMRSLSIHAYWTSNILMGIRARAMLAGIVYSKLMKLPDAGADTGLVLNIVQTDTERVREACVFGPFIIMSPVFMIFATVACFHLIGYSALLGFLVMPPMVAVQVAIAKKIGYQRERSVIFTDQRVSLMAELLRAIQLVKMYNWESSFAKKVDRIRSKEVKELWKASCYKIINVALTDTAMIACACITFVCHVFVFDEELTAKQAFSVLAIINYCRFPLTLLATSIKFTSEAFIGLKRVRDFLLRAEFNAEEKLLRENLRGDDALVLVTNARFRRLDTQTGHMSSGKNLTSDLFISNLIVQKATLTMIVGRVGSGKTSLLTGALLGEIRLVNRSETGCKAVVRGRKAYVSQLPWVFNGTVKENIILTRNYDPAKFKNIVKLCCLELDIQMFPGGEETELGERGINISGGQKTRIALARALYSDADLYVLDDVLSAVDAHVSKSLFYDCILNYLVKRGKTVVLATHAVNYFHEADNLVVLKDMRILDQGKYSELLTREDENHRNLVISCMSSPEECDKQKVNTVSEYAVEVVNIDKRDSSVTVSALSKSKGKLLVKEKAAQGAVDWKTISHYIGGSGGKFVFALIILLFCGGEGVRALADYWLTFWTTEGIHRFSDREYAIVYSLLVVLLAIVLLFRGIVFFLAGLRAATRMHNQAFASVLAAKISFFHVTELGIVLNRFSGDMDKLDIIIMEVGENVFSICIRVFIAILIVAAVTPAILVAILPVVCLFSVMLGYCRDALRKLKRIELMSRTPLISHCESTVRGLSTIKAFEEDEIYLQRAFGATDLSSRALTGFWLTNRWIGMRLDFVSTWIIFCSAMSAVVFSSTFSAGLAGLMITSALQTGGFLQFSVRQAADLEANLTSVERIRSFVVDTPSEKQTIVSETSVPSTWPSKGSIKFINYSAKYRVGLPNILNQISLSIKGGQKAALTGRTGSGKSTTLLCLFRILEASAGQILIDGVDIASVPLARLRSTALSIVPQDAVLFKGSIRSNLDPFNNYSDEEIWSALKRVHLTTPNESNGLSLKLTGSESSKDLGYPVEEGGDNLSKGQRQLLCFARTLLRNSRIICIDEGTSSVDETSDQLIQQTLRESFANNTLVIIAHRLKTVRDVDVIFVLSEGRVIEEGAPEVLINKENGVFSEMWKAQV